MYEFNQKSVIGIYHNGKENQTFFFGGGGSPESQTADVLAAQT